MRPATAARPAQLPAGRLQRRPSKPRAEAGGLPVPAPLRRRRPWAPPAPYLKHPLILLGADVHPFEGQRRRLRSALGRLRLLGGHHAVSRAAGAGVCAAVRAAGRGSRTSLLRRGRGRGREEEVGSWAAGGAIGPTASEGGAGRSRAAARDVGGELSRGAGGPAGSGSVAQGAPAEGGFWFVPPAGRLAPPRPRDPRTREPAPSPAAHSPGLPFPYPRSSWILPDPSRYPRSIRRRAAERGRRACVSTTRAAGCQPPRLPGRAS